MTHSEVAQSAELKIPFQVMSTELHGTYNWIICVIPYFLTFTDTDIDSTSDKFPTSSVVWHYIFIARNLY